ncbi:hypothetical protein V1511DRAFT_460339 [Dipodascopsis uninucleata]
MNVLWQSITEIVPPKPEFTESDLGDLTGKVCLITGATDGIGRELAKFLYSKNAIIYVGTRSQNNYDKTVKYITLYSPDSQGELHLLQMDLMDLVTVKAAADLLLSKTSKLDYVWYNAGVMGHPIIERTKQNFELHWGTNVVGHFVLNELLTPLLISSGQKALSESTYVRVVWLASDANLFAPADGINWEDINYENAGANQMTKYGQSKSAAIILAYEFSKRMHGKGIISISMNPGHLKTGLQENRPKWLKQLGNLFSYDAKYGAYTELFGAFSDKVDITKSGSYIIPWGRLGFPRSDIESGYLHRGTGERLRGILLDSVKDYIDVK